MLGDKALLHRPWGDIVECTRHTVFADPQTDVQVSSTLPMIIFSTILISLAIVHALAATKYNCSKTEFKCSIDNKCIPLLNVQDGINDCIDGSDEGLYFDILLSFFYKIANFVLSLRRQSQTTRHYCIISKNLRSILSTMWSTYELSIHLLHFFIRDKI